MSAGVARTVVRKASVGCSAGVQCETLETRVAMAIVPLFWATRRAFDAFASGICDTVAACCRSFLVPLLP